MKTIKKFNALIFALFVVLILSFTTKVNSQVIVKLQYPPPNQVSIEDVWKLQLITNTSQEDDYHIYLLGTITNDDNGDLIWEGKSSPFYLYKGYSGPIEPSDLEPVSGNFNSKYEKLKEIAIRTGTLPAGNYTFCVSVINDDGQGLGKDCIQVNVAHPSPPELISPQDGAIAKDEYPVFMWMPPMPTPPGQIITYNLIIIELLDGQTKEEAIQSNPPWFEEKDIQTTSFQYPVSSRKFESGENYGWQVICFMDPNLAKGIKSEVWSFEFGKEQNIISNKWPLTVLPDYEHKFNVKFNLNPQRMGIDTTSCITPKGDTIFLIGYHAIVEEHKEPIQLDKNGMLISGLDMAIIRPDGIIRHILRFFRLDKKKGIKFELCELDENGNAIRNVHMIPKDPTQGAYPVCEWWLHAPGGSYDNVKITYKGIDSNGVITVHISMDCDVGFLGGYSWHSECDYYI